MSILSNSDMHFRLRDGRSHPTIGSARIAAFTPLPDVLSEFGVDVRDVILDAGLPMDLFDDPDNLIPYRDLGRLLAVGTKATGCDHLGLLLGQRGRLATMGLAGQIALCADTAGGGLQNLADFFALHNTAATVGLVTAGSSARLVFSIVEPSMDRTGQIQLGAMAVGCNILQDLCGQEFVPAAVNIAGRVPANPRPCQKHFRAPVRFDSAESAIIFDRHWIDRPLPKMDPLRRRRIEAEARTRRNEFLADFPASLRHVLSRLMMNGKCSMEAVAARLFMHRRTLDRRLKQHGLMYGDVLESVKREVACRLLLDTELHVQQVAEKLDYASAANFTTAFRGWTGVTPTEYRHNAAR